MDCGTPFCHTACPVNNLIPEWNNLVEERHWRTAWQQLDSSNNFPELTGRLCPAPCEDACTLSLADRPVTIKAIELAIAEHAWQAGWVQPEVCSHRRAEQVTVVGSGPAGLACAQLLARVGYRVRVLEKADRIGGLLRYGIPDFRLEKSTLDRRLQQLEAEGVEFMTGVRPGQDPETDRLTMDSNALVLACGARQAREVTVPGSELKGIHYALPYLEQQNRHIAGELVKPENEVCAAGRDVVVIGGGDTGSDCVGTALRQRARRVTQLQYHERPPTHADILQYWPAPLPALKQTDTQAEGCVKIWGWETTGFEGTDGHVSHVVLRPLRWWQDEAGCWRKQAVEKQRWRLPAQLVLIAIGYAHTEHGAWLSRLGVELDARGNVAANDESYATSVPGIFSCGDMRRGQSLIVWAIREGRRCARAVDAWLSGESELPLM